MERKQSLWVWAQTLLGEDSGRQRKVPLQWPPRLPAGLQGVWCSRSERRPGGSGEGTSAYAGEPGLIPSTDRSINHRSPSLSGQAPAAYTWLSTASRQKQGGGVKGHRWGNQPAGQKVPELSTSLGNTKREDPEGRASSLESHTADGTGTQGVGTRERPHSEKDPRGPAQSPVHRSDTGDQAVRGFRTPRAPAQHPVQKTVRPGEGLAKHTQQGWERGPEPREGPSNSHLRPRDSHTPPARRKTRPRKGNTAKRDRTKAGELCVAISRPAHHYRAQESARAPRSEP